MRLEMGLAKEGDRWLSRRIAIFERWLSYICRGVGGKFLREGWLTLMDVLVVTM